MIPYDVIKEEKSGKTVIKCSYCNKVFKTVQHHELHRCRKENNFSGECLSCKTPYNNHAVPKSDNSIVKGVCFILFILFMTIKFCPHFFIAFFGKGTFSMRLVLHICISLTKKAMVPNVMDFLAGNRAVMK